ncbi:MAG: hydrogenase maturation nickel metallochaperone HypA [Myxococcales bacterium]|nr:hydrogenase maturation nickel metallochaperone HypA [Myxococcales bacterium]
MHELSICQALLDQVTDLARDHRAQSVRSIEVSIGPLSGVEPDLLERAFSVAKIATVAELSELRLRVDVVKVVCESCGAESQVEPNRLLCGACGDWHTRVCSGRDLILSRVELELPEEVPSHV